MIIYKITNKQNGKVYIGQTTGTLINRESRHYNDAESGRLSTHFAQAIRKYGRDSFESEIIDSANSQEELNQKEHHWINFYDSVKKGYNETDSILKSGGNTYQYKTNEEMYAIKEKIRQTKIGGKNPNATKIKCRNEETGEILRFDSMSEAAKYFKQPNHNFISARCRGKNKTLWNRIWNFAYEDDSFNALSREKNNNRSRQIQVLDLETEEKQTFPSYASAERYFNVPSKSFSGHAYKHKNDEFFIARQRYKITVLN